MNQFLHQIVKFILVLFIPVGILSVGFFLPATPRTKTSLLFGEVLKDSLLKNVEAPRIIFIGGSSLSFGLNSQMLKDSLHINPINTGLHINLGLQYILKHALPYIKQGDIVIIAPEYQHFTRDYDAGSRELLGIVIDVNRNNFRLLSFRQVYNLIPYMSRYALSKLCNPKEYLLIATYNEKWYLVDSFNQFGDVDAYWNETGGTKITTMPVSGKMNWVVFDKIKAFEQEFMKRGATLYVSYPPCQDKSFQESIAIINEIQRTYESDFKVLGTPQRYMMPDSLMFVMAYHCNKKGMDIRTQLLIEDIRKAGIIKEHPESIQ